MKRWLGLWIKVISEVEEGKEAKKIFKKLITKYRFPTRRNILGAL